MKKYCIFAVILLMPLFASAQTFERDLEFGMQNDTDVTKLQEFLTDEGLYSGPITGNFFSLTLKAVKKFQTREGITPAAGYFGPKTRVKVNTVFSTSIKESNEQALAEGVVTTTPAPVTSTQATQKSQPNVMDSIMAQIAELQKQIDSLLKKTPTSLTQTTILPNQTLVVPQSVPQNAPLTNQSLSNTTNTSPQSTQPKIVVPPPLPKVTVSHGKVDNRTNQPYKKPGTKDYIFAGIKITTDKEMFLNSIKWNMSGSGGGSSFANLTTYINDIPYDIIRSSDGKYFISNFDRVIVNRNETKEIYIKGDILEEDQHTLNFDIYKASDINITDENGNVITPQAEQLWNYENSGGFRSSNPWYDGYKVEMEPKPPRP